MAVYLITVALLIYMDLNTIEGTSFNIPRDQSLAFLRRKETEVSHECNGACMFMSQSTDKTADENTAVSCSQDEVDFLDDRTLHWQQRHKSGFLRLRLFRTRASCNTVKKPCNDLGECICSIPRHTCRCKPGYTGDCDRDINECSVGTDRCSRDASCRNTIGSYTCTCYGGFSGDGIVCSDIDECQKDTDSCSPNASCRNTHGSYICTCSNGFTGDGRTCEDENECSVGKDRCSTDASCNNTFGSYTCKCNAGFSGDGIACTDIDECQKDTDSCSPNASCRNTHVSYICTCNNGFTGDGRTCEDENECSVGKDRCSTDASCKNTFGSYTCKCNAGFSGDGIACTDFDECLKGTSSCSPNALCKNTPGSYECTCNNGFSGDGRICTDKNECYHGVNMCSLDAFCRNTIGSYTCTCNAGFSGDGIVCTDIDECADDPCVHGSCNNLIDAFTCDCEAGFEGDRCDKDINECKNNPCQNGATCNDHINRYSCTCTEDYTDYNCSTDMCYPSEGADFVMILDSSTSQSKDNFQRQKEFAQSLCNTFPIGKHQFRFSVVTVSGTASVNFALDSHLTNESLIEAIDEIAPWNGSSNAHNAIRFARDDLFTNSFTTTKKYIIILGDGLYSRSSETKAEALRTVLSGVTLISVGFGDQILQQGLIDSTTDHLHVFSSITPDLKNWLLKRHILNGCPDCTSQRADIFILLETSRDLSYSVFYGLLRSFESLIRRIPITQDRVHVSVATFDNMVSQKFDFAAYYSQQSIITNVVSTTKKTQKTSNITNALQHIKDKVFLSSTDYRQGARKIAILFMSHTVKDFDIVKGKADALKADDVIIVVITFTSESKPKITDLLEIVSDPAYLFVIGETVYGGETAFDALTTLYEYTVCMFD